MAKMFYSMEEVQEKLSCTEAQIKEYVQNGQLREFRDGSKILFKVDEVDSLAGSSAGDAIPDVDVDLGLELDGSSIGLAGSSIGLASEDSFTAEATAVGDVQPLDDDEDDLLAGSEAINLDGSSIGLAPTESEAGLYSTADASSDGSLSLEAKMGEETQPAKDDTVVTTHGIDALEDNEADADVDPLAQTKVSSPMQLDDEISLDPGSSGSGLLDLSREADDTSLGADILKDIYDEGIGDLGGDDDKAPMLEAVDDDDDAEAIAEPIVEDDSSDEFNSPAAISPGMPGVGGPRAAAMQIYDSTSGAFGFMMLIAFVMLVYMAFNVVAFTSGTTPGILQIVNDNMMWVTIGAGVVALLFLVIGLVMAGGGGGRSAKPAKEKVAKKKEKKTKAKKTRKKKK